MFFKGKKVLVTGAGGMTGHALCNKLTEVGAEVIASGHSKEIACDAKYFEYGDLTTLEYCHYLCGHYSPDYFFQAAAVTSGANVMQNAPLTHLTPNILINTSVLDAAYKHHIKKVLCYSSTTMYPERHYPVSEHEAYEDDPYEKYFIVGWLKRHMEVLCRTYSEKVARKMPCLVLRPANIIGPRDKFDEAISHVLPAMIRKIVGRMNPLEVWGDGTEQRDFLYVDDMVDLSLLTMEKIDTYLPINAGSGTQVSVKEIIDIICKLENFYPEIKYLKDKPTMIPKRAINVDRAKQLLNFQATIPIEVAIQKTINWYKENVCPKR